MHTNYVSQNTNNAMYHERKVRSISTCITSKEVTTEESNRKNIHSGHHIRGGKKKQLSTNLTLYKAHTNHWTNLRRAEAKRKNEFNLEAWGKETSNTVN